MKNLKREGIKLLEGMEGYERRNWNKGMEKIGITGWVGIKGNRIRDDMTKGMDGKNLETLETLNLQNPEPLKS